MHRFLLLAAAAWGLLAYASLLSAQTAAEPQFAAKLSAAELKIETALAAPVKLSYREQPLKDVIADLAKQANLPIELDPEGLEEADVSTDQLVTLELGMLGLRQALGALLSPLHLTYVPSAVGLGITSEETASERPVLRVYPVADLIPKAVGRDGRHAVLDYDTLIDTITSHLRPDSWPDRTGPGPVRWGPGGCLTVRQTLEIQYEIEQLLRAMRELGTEQANRRPDDIGAIIDLTNTKSIREALDKRDSTTLDIELKFYVQDVAKVIHAPVLLDPEGLAEVDVPVDRMIHVAYKDAPIGDVFREALAKLHLGYTIHDGYVLVTSQEKCGETLQTRLYPVGDLAPLRAIQEPPTRDFDTLIDFITDNVNDASVWTDHGGSSSISGWPRPAALIISAHDEVHDDVEQLLAKLRQTDIAAFNAEQAKADQRIVERVYPLYMARRGQNPKSGKIETDKAEKEHEAKRPAEKIPTADDVAKLVEELLPEASFQEKGTLLRPFHDRLIVRHRPAMLHKIEELLKKIDAWPPQGQGGMGGGGFF